ncbi:helix-turn-helix transcriptional regulator [Dactylosporangium aurantiacum]|uniref:Helix-turn-helix transcriptional regulator n=1 Tax=Dactylosporangium aurantiacum TaxID=35754 RepID=A0A9Q9ILD0_9ACTN|nr:helix-turn-helix domain-containing protein [Dactylosporangium aurantiacum]MDG6103186.1 helix-turn-helix domain-containing protein [Dactylosporangium aurantiacum]UWZ57691.1 helix-turn-helix transcriptional regulator [Dactylosporangium aurantiacum]
MGREARRTITEPEVLRILAHPVRYELLSHLLAVGPATASQCARAVGDTPSNCSYHLRALAKAGLVAPGDSADGRERPWRALVTGFSVPHDADPGSSDGRQAAVIAALAVQRDQRLVRERLARRDRSPERWRDAEQYGLYTLRLTPAELRTLGDRIDALIRPYIAATRDDTPTGAETVHFGFHGFPLNDAGNHDAPEEGETP